MVYYSMYSIVWYTIYYNILYTAVCEAPGAATASRRGRQAPAAKGPKCLEGRRDVFSSASFVKYIHTYITICVYMYVCIYIYIYT